MQQARLLQVVITGAAVAASLLGPAPGGAQSLDDLSPSVREFVSVSEDHVVIRGAQLIDGTGAPARRGMSIEIRGGQIVSIGTVQEVGAPEGAVVIEAAGHTVIPGLVMLHEHLFYPSGQARYNTNEISFPPLYLAGGVTTMRTGGSVEIGRAHV